MNKLPPHMTTGTFGELLVQLRLLQYEVQAAPPVKDTGNDLIAVKGFVFKAIQVKTTKQDGSFKLGRLKKRCYHLAALVALHMNGPDEVNLDETRIVLVPREELVPCDKTEQRTACTIDSLGRWQLNAELVDYLFSPPPQAS